MHNISDAWGHIGGFKIKVASNLDLEILVKVFQEMAAKIDSWKMDRN